MKFKPYLKIIGGILLFIFFIANGYIIASLLRPASNSEPSTYEITEYLEGSTTSKKTIKRESITSANSFSLLTESTKIYALPDTEFSITTNSIKLIKGTLFLTSSNLNIEIQGSKFNLANQFSAILDSDDGVIIAEGDAAFNSKILDINTQILTTASAIDTYEFDREKLSTESKYTQLSSLLTTLNLLPEYFKDNTPPELISISPRDGFITQERFIRLYGYTELDAKVTIEAETLTVDEDGYFTKQIDLEVGSNPLTLYLKDKFGNQKVVNLKYERKAPTLPLSFPTSFPVSYTN